MALYTEQLQQLYIAYFKRPADVAGLALWESAASDRGIEALLPGFGQSAEYASLYQGLNNAQLVNALYQNLFGRDAEPAGVAFWAAKLESGELTRDTLPLSLIRGAGVDDALALEHKTAAAVAFTNALDTTAKAEGYSGDAANDIARAWLATITDEPASATAAATAMPSVLSNAVDAGNGISHGVVVDGYVAGATIFADANGNGTWDEGEARTVTDARGNFTLADAQGTLIATGGTDVGTNLAFTGMMIAPEGATIINPITTLQETLIRQGQSTDQAQATISTAFGISVANLDFDQRDPLAAAFQPGASAADLALAVHMQAAAAKIQNLLVAASQALTGAITGLSSADASTAAANALAEVVRNDADGVVSLADTTVLTSVLTGAAEQAGATGEQAAAVAAITPGFSAIMAATATAIDTISASTTMSAGLALARILQVETAAQGTVTTAIRDAAASGDISAATQQFTGAQLTSTILETKIGDVVPGAAPDSAIIEIVNGTEPTPEGPDTTAPAAPTGLALAAADDTGSSNSDGITKNSSGLTINGNAETGSTVDLYEDLGNDNLVFMGTATAVNGSFSIDVNLEQGSHQLVAKATDAANNTGVNSSPLTITVDRDAPTGLQVRSLLDYGSSYLSSTYSDLVAAGNSLVQVGGTNNFGTELVVGDIDDDFLAIDVSSVFASGLTLGGVNYSAVSELFLGTNGYVTFGEGNDSYDPAGIAGYTISPMIAAFFDDIDASESVSQSAGGNSAGSNKIYYDVDSEDNVVTFTWDDVAPYDLEDDFLDIPGVDYSTGNAFQIRLHHVQGSNFVIEMRYENISWIGGAGDEEALPSAGWTAGDGINYGEVEGSGTVGMLDLESTSNIGQAGVYLWEVKNGAITENLVDVDDVAGKIAFELVATDETEDDVLTYSLGTGADNRFSIVNGNQIKVAANATFDLDVESTITLPVMVTDKAGNVQERDVLLTLFSAPDVTAPTLASSTPADDAANVAANANIVLTFSETVQAGTGNFVLIDDSNEGSATNIAVGSVTINGNTVTINPAGDLVAGHDYHLEMASGVLKDAAGNAYAGIADGTTLNFSVAAVPDVTAPTLSSSTPADDDASVAIDADIVLTFSEAVQAGTGNISLVQDDLEGTTIDIAVGSGEVVFNGSTVTINPLADLVAGANYHIEIAGTAIKDSANNAFAGISSATALNFSTAAAEVDVTDPMLESTTPATNATGVALNANLVLNFDEDVKAGTGDIKIYRDDGEGMSTLLETIDATDTNLVTFADDIMTINPDNDFDWNEVIYVQVDSGAVVDLAGNAFAGISDTTTFTFGIMLD